MSHCIGPHCANPGPCACSCNDCIALRERPIGGGVIARVRDLDSCRVCGAHPGEPHVKRSHRESDQAESLTGDTLAGRVKLEHRAAEILLAWRQGLAIWDAVLVVADELVAFEKKYGAER